MKRLLPRSGRQTGALGSALVVLLATAAAGCGGSSAPKPVVVDGCTVVSKPKLGARSEPKPSALLATGVHYTVTLVTNCGSFSIAIDQKESPNAAASFVSLVKKGFFNDTIFHRIIPGFVIQGGDPTGTGEGGPGYTTIDPPPKDAAYTEGVVAMAKSEAQANGTAGSQFFVVTEANAGLPAQYAIIGHVTSGLKVALHIASFGTDDAEGTPTRVIELERATVSSSS